MSQNTNKPLSKNPTWKAIGAYAEAKEEIARLTAENERLRKALKEIEKAWYNQRMADVIRIVDEAFEEQTK